MKLRLEIDLRLRDTLKILQDSQKKNEEKKEEEEDKI